MAKKFGPEQDAPNIEHDLEHDPDLEQHDFLNHKISTVVDEILFLLAKRRAAAPGDAQSKSGQYSVGHGKASATWQVSCRAHSYGLKPLRDRELKSIYALLAWVANEQGAAPETVQAITESRFGVHDVTTLLQKDYDEVIKFLVDLRIDEIRH